MIIVVGVDDSVRSAIAARKASRLAVWLDADLHAVYVSHIPAAMLAVLAGVPDGTTEFADAQSESVWDRVGPVLDASEARVIRVE
ncbi:MAG: universal stress protein, partial [Acidimicrobiia bacterium]|nr:universal stress protein [Acidimicrobiia bacterium]